MIFSSIMFPRLYMHSLQYVFFTSAPKEITFVTRHASGRRYNFVLTKNQFFALNDAILLIQRDNSYGHFPLGENVWIHYNAFDASLYKDPLGRERVYFTFACFEEYVKYTHRRILSLIRLNASTSATSMCSRRRGRGGRSILRGRRRVRKRGEAESSSSPNKRPSPTSVQSSNRSPTPKRTCGGTRQTVPRTTDHAVMSLGGHSGPILPKWHHSNSRRECDSVSLMSYTSQDLSPPPSIEQCDASSSSSGEQLDY